MKVVKIKKWPTLAQIRKWTKPVYALSSCSVLFVRTVNNDYRYIARIKKSAYGPGACFSDEISKIFTDGFFNFYGSPTPYTQEWLMPRVLKLKNFKEIIKAIEQDKKVPAGQEVKKVNVELGVELELENKNSDNDADDLRYMTANELIDNVGYDGSVFRGNEFRFRHPSIKGWALSKITNVLSMMVREGYANLYGTAGMHVHVSGPNATVAALRAKNSIRAVNRILEPICGRRRYIQTPGNSPRAGYYGRGSNSLRSQLGDFGTLEFRAFEATTDPHVFYWRLIVCKALFEHLAADKPLRSFFKDMKPRVKSAYKSLLTHPTNPHDYGADVETVLTWLK